MSSTIYGWKKSNKAGELMKKLDTQSVLDFANEQDVTQIGSSYSTLLSILNSAMEQVSSRNMMLVPLNEVYITPINSFSNASNTTVSELDVLVSINSTQLEHNSYGLILTKWQKFTKDIKTAWKNRNKKKKKKKKKREVKQQAVNYYDQLPYNIMRLKNDLFEEIVNRMTNLSIVYNQAYKISVVANQELGFVFNVYTGIKSGESTKIWNMGANSFDVYNFNKMQNFIMQKTAIVGPNFLKVFRIFNNLYYYIYKKQPTIGLIESIMMSIPEKLFAQTTIENCFCSIINYINNVKGYLLFKNSHIDEFVTTKNQQTQLKTQTVNFIKQICKVL